jgi:hypothetical protein
MTDYHAAENRRLRARLDAAEKREKLLYRILAFMLTERFQDTDVDPLEYLQAVHDVADHRS